MRTHCNDLTSPYVKLAVWSGVCVINNWLLCPDFPFCLHLSSSMSRERLPSVAGSLHTNTLVLLVICFDGLSLSWNSSEPLFIYLL